MAPSTEFKKLSQSWVQQPFPGFFEQSYPSFEELPPTDMSLRDWLLEGGVFNTISAVSKLYISQNNALWNLIREIHADKLYELPFEVDCASYVTCAVKKTLCDDVPMPGFPPYGLSAWADSHLTDRDIDQINSFYHLPLPRTAAAVATAIKEIELFDITRYWYPDEHGISMKNAAVTYQDPELFYKDVHRVTMPHFARFQAKGEVQNNASAEFISTSNEIKSINQREHIDHIVGTMFYYYANNLSRRFKAIKEEHYVRRH